MSDGINAVICSEDLVYLVLLLHDDGPDFRLHVCRQGVNIGYSSLRYIRMRPASSVQTSLVSRSMTLQFIRITMLFCVVRLLFYGVCRQSLRQHYNRRKLLMVARRTLDRHSVKLGQIEPLLCKRPSDFSSEVYSRILLFPSSAGCGAFAGFASSRLI